MFCITIALKDNPAIWTLLFKESDTVNACWKRFEEAQQNHTVIFLDDFGQTVMVDRASVAGAMFEDLDKSMLAHIERGLPTARTQATAHQHADADPLLKTARMTRNGPGIFDPQAGNGYAHR